MRLPGGASRGSLLATGLALAALYLGCRSELQAQTVSNLAGVWNNVLFSVPAQLTLVKDAQGRVLEIQERDLFETEVSQITVQADGTFAGAAAGSVSFAGPGLVQAIVPGDGGATFAINAACDFMYGVKTTSQGRVHDLELFVKAPTTLSTADLAGSWRMFSLGSPAALRLSKNTNGYVVEVDGWDQFSAGMGAMTVQADGSLSGSFGGGFTGTVAVGAQGTVQATIQPTGEPSLTRTLYVNQGKDVLIGGVSLLGSGDNYQEAMLFIRAPASAASADLKGLWRAGSLLTPSALTLVKDLQGVVREIPEWRNFEVDQETTYVGHTGVMLAPAYGSIGLLTLSDPGTVQVTMTNSTGEIETPILWLNASKDVLVSYTAGSENEIMLVTRAPALTGPARAAGMWVMAFPRGDLVEIVWPSDTNRFLVSSTNLITWNVVPDTQGRSSYLVDPRTDVNRFCQAAESP